MRGTPKINTHALAGSVELQKRFHRSYNAAIEAVFNLYEIAIGKTWSKKRKSEINDLYDEVVGPLKNCLLLVLGRQAARHHMLEVWGYTEQEADDVIRELFGRKKS